MRTKLNITILSALLLLFVAACTPQIRFATRSSMLSSGSHSHKANVKSSNSKTGATVYSMPDYSADANLDIKRKEVLTFAESLIGTPYCYGGTDKNCTDCSGFVKQIYEMAGINLPRTAALQYDYGKEINENETSPGDLVFFNRNNKIGHVGIYIGNNHFIHASTNKGVVLQSLEDDFYKQTFAGFKKVL
ncbi:MAG: C40 family peptidase [bacterium]